MRQFRLQRRAEIGQARRWRPMLSCGHCCARQQWPAEFHATRLRRGNKKMGAKMADQWVRLGMAIVIIALISIGLYQFSGRASAVEPTVSGIAYRP